MVLEGLFIDDAGEEILQSQCSGLFEDKAHQDSTIVLSRWFWNGRQLDVSTGGDRMVAVVPWDWALQIGKVTLRGGLKMTGHSVMTLGRDYTVTVDSCHGHEMYVFVDNTCPTGGNVMNTLENGHERKIKCFI